jgi:probable phosphomutase (TIGR03848 family)
MARIVLLRHAHSVANEKNILAGRSPGISLSKTGSKQAEALADRLGNVAFDQIFVSPMERCHQTIAPWLANNGQAIPLSIDHDISEVDYGTWTGKSLASLRRKALWKTVADQPSQMIFPDGESLLQMQSRALSSFYRLNAVKGKKARLLVSHGDVIKSIVAHCLGMHLDQFQKLVIEPASLTVIDTDNGVSRLITFNDTAGNLSRESAAPTAATAIGGATGNKA